MSIIMPAGNKKIDWSPKEEKLQKTAGAEGKEVAQEEVNPLYEAAKKHMEEMGKQQKEAGLIPGVPDGTGPHGMGPEKGRGMGPCGEGGPDEEGDVDAVVLDVEEVADESGAEEVSQSVSEAVAEVEAKAEAAEDVVEQVAEAVDKIEIAVQEVKDVCGKTSEGGEGGEEEEVEVEIDVPGEEEVDEEVIVEGDTEEDDEEEVAMDKAASTEEEFCRFAKLSAGNRKKLTNYWVKQLGYPRDYVALLTKDYEK